MKCCVLFVSGLAPKSLSRLSFLQLHSNAPLESSPEVEEKSIKRKLSYFLPKELLALTVGADRQIGYMKRSVLCDLHTHWTQTRTRFCNRCCSDTCVIICINRTWFVPLYNYLISHQADRYELSLVCV